MEQQWYDQDSKEVPAPADAKTRCPQSVQVRPIGLKPLRLSLLDVQPKDRDDLMESLGCVFVLTSVSWNVDGNAVVVLSPGNGMLTAPD